MEEFVIRDESGYCVDADLITVNGVEYSGTYMFHTREEAQTFINDVFDGDTTCTIHQI